MQTERLQLHHYTHSRKERSQHIETPRPESPQRECRAIYMRRVAQRAATGFSVWRAGNLRERRRGIFSQVMELTIFENERGC